MTIRRVLFVLIPTLMLAGYAVRAEKDELKSGPQVEDKLPGPFLSLVTNSEDPSLVGKKIDFFERYGGDPAVLVVAREMTKPLAGLVKKLDAEVAEMKSAKLRVIIVILSDGEAVEKDLTDLAQKEGTRNVNLAIMEPDGPKRFKLAKDAEVTVLMYKNRIVKANHAFKGRLDEKDVERVLADLPKIVSKLPAEEKQETMDLSIYRPADIKWKEGPASIPAGAKLAVLEGDPSKEGPFVIRLKLPDGYRIAPHTHPKPERLTVISGTFNIGMGEKFDASKGTAMPAGTFGTWAPGMKHFVWTKGETVVQLHGTGPWMIEYVDPSDDPRKGKK
jgi:ChrR Cupin-like domain